MRPQLRSAQFHLSFFIFLKLAEPVIRNQRQALFWNKYLNCVTVYTQVLYTDINLLCQAK